MSDFFTCGSRILGWDAAWTPRGSGAWAVVEKGEVGWRVEVLENCPGGERETAERFGELVRAFCPACVAVDMPLGVRPVRGYREADRATTRAFSRYGCPVHSPTPARPGAWGDFLMREMMRHGLALATSGGWISPVCLEVYPHTALLQMVRAGYRLPYKVQRAGGYHPELEPAERRAKVAEVFRRIEARVREWCEVPGGALELREEAPRRLWKAAEDRLDALVCAWAGMQAGEGAFLPYGNAEAAIWNPNLKELDPPRRIG